MATTTFSSTLKSLFIVSMATISLLTGCGKHDSSKLPVDAATEKAAKANQDTPCFYAAGRPGKNDAELFIASAAGDVRRVEQAINAGGNVRATDSLKRTPLFAAVFCDHADVAIFLLDKGSDINARDFLGMSPLHAAVIAGGNEVAKTLILRGADVNSQSNTGRTPLHLAAATKQMALVELLMERGANGDMPDRNGITAAALASNNGHPAVVATIKEWQEKQKTASAPLPGG